MNDEQLQALVERLSLQFFEKPFKHKAKFNSRLRTTGGRYLLVSHNIEINRKYYEEFGENELIGIIKHELCHYHLHLEGKGYQHRDKDFRHLLKKVDAPRFCTPLSKVAKPDSQIVYVYACERCNTIYRRKKKVNLNKYVCGKCRGKLKLLKKLSNF